METIAIIGGGAAGLAAAVAAANELVFAGGSEKTSKTNPTCKEGDLDTGGVSSAANASCAMGGVGEVGTRAAVDAVEVVVFEADERVGRSILATGNGRCNFSNAQVDAEKYRNAEFVAEALCVLRSSFGCAAAADADDNSVVKKPTTVFAAGAPPFNASSASGVSIAAASAIGSPAADRLASAVNTSAANEFAPDPVHAFFADLGLVWREEGEGRLYPLANKASSVLDVLRLALARFGVRVECDRRAMRIDPPEHAHGRYHIRFADGSVVHAREVIVAPGGRVKGELLPESLPFVEQRCTLGPLRTDDQIVKSLNNVRVRCSVALVAPSGLQKAAESGEVLFRDYGVSGIAVFNLSRFAEPGDVLRIDLLPQYGFRACEEALRLRLCRFGSEWFSGMLLPSVARAACKQAGLRLDEPFGGGEKGRDADAAALACALKEFSLRVCGVGDAKQCQVTRGGFAVDAFDPATMEARALPGLHVVGEALDIDAPCGGYNLHWAWASGMLAGFAAARRLLGESGADGSKGIPSGGGCDAAAFESALADAPEEKDAWR